MGAGSRLIQAYIMRHGTTEISPKPEGWLQVPLNREGWNDAQAGADFLAQFIRDGGPRPDWAISSDLARAEQTLAIVADSLNLRVLDPIIGLRAFEDKQESPARYEERTLEALNAVLTAARENNSIPLIVAHRSTTGFLGKHFELWLRTPDYRYDSLLLEGGVMGLSEECGAIPLFRSIEKNWPDHIKCQH